MTVEMGKRSMAEESWDKNPNTSKTRILVIDDEPLIRQVFVAFLKQWGYQSFEAENGRVGIDVFTREEIDLVLTDLNMPVMSGVEVLAYIHENSPDTPVVIISGAGQLDDAVQSVKLGAWDYLTKPIANMAILENTISRCLEKVRLIRENRMYQQHLEEEVAGKTEELRRKNIALQAEVAERRQKEEEVRQINRYLETIVDASGQLFHYSSIHDLLRGTLQSLHGLLHREMGRVLATRPGEGDSGFALLEVDAVSQLVGGWGRFASCRGESPHRVLPDSLYQRLVRVLEKGESTYGDKEYFGFIHTPNHYRAVFYLDGCHLEDEAEMRLVRIYLNNIASAIDSLALQEEIVNTQKEVVITLGEVIETRSHEAANHVRRVAEYTYLLARKYGLSEEESEALCFASPMHDAGKIGIPDALLNKVGRLTDQEMELMQCHTTMGFDILKSSQREILQTAAIVAHQHHERWDGCGYPQGLHQENIHLYGRIVGLADVFDALSSRRCYKDPWSIEEVVEFIRREKGHHFEPRLVDILMDNLAEFIDIQKRYPDN